MKPTRALVTLLIGERYEAFWHKYCRANWEQYAARHGAVLVVIDQLLDTSARALARPYHWQKLLVLSQPAVQSFEQVIWLDADVLIHPCAPWVGDNVPPHLVGATDEYGYPSPALNRRALSKLYALWEKRIIPFAPNLTAREFYTVAGYDTAYDKAVQTGILVLAPSYHRELFEYVYSHYEHASHLRGLKGEMRPLSYELMREDLVHWIDLHWNANWQFERVLRYPFLFLEPAHPLLSRCATRALSQNYSVHFAGAMDELQYVDLSASRLGESPNLKSYASPTEGALDICRSPVAVFLFNRPETTSRVMDSLRTVRPQQLYLIADGPRADYPNDRALCETARHIASIADWECKIRTNFSETNMGLKRRLESGLDWLFGQVPEAIILEDDCVPDPTFFRFCDELLARYREDERIMVISGSDFTFGLSDVEASYRFSRYSLIWGWATWARAWRKNDPDMSSLPAALASNRLQDILGEARAAQYWGFVLNDRRESATTWDSAWLWSIWEQGGLCIHPNVNLIENIGFGPEATHTRDAGEILASLLHGSMEFPLRHPFRVERNCDSDALTEELGFSGSLRRIWARVRAQRRSQTASGS